MSSLSCPCRITLAIIGLSWLVIGTTLVGFLPESRYSNTPWQHSNTPQQHSNKSQQHATALKEVVWGLGSNVVFMRRCTGVVRWNLACLLCVSVRRTGWASWSIWPATGSVPEDCQPPSSTTTSQLQLLLLLFLSSVSFIHTSGAANKQCRKGTFTEAQNINTVLRYLYFIILCYFILLLLHISEGLFYLTAAVTGCFLEIERDEKPRR